MVPERGVPSTFGTAIIFFLFALKQVHALTPEMIEILYRRFVIDTEDKSYWRIWWDTYRQLQVNIADDDALRPVVFNLIQCTEWRRLFFNADGQAPLLHHLINYIVDVNKEYAMQAPSDGIAIFKTIQHLMKEAYLAGIDEYGFRGSFSEIAAKLFCFYPTTAEDRHRLADMLLTSASSGSESQRGVDCQLLRALFQSDPSETVPDWNKEDCMTMLCQRVTSLPEIILDECSTWKLKQYVLGLENTDRTAQIQIRLQFLTSALVMNKAHFSFSRELLDRLWNSALSRPSDVGPGEEQQYWGGDHITDTARLIFFHFLINPDIRLYQETVLLLK
jgi:hypothetical protein